MELIFDLKQIRLKDFLRPLRMSFPQSFSEIRDNWEQKRHGGVGGEILIQMII